jgi:hypothetical protein
MTRRHLTTAITLIVLVGILVVGVVMGVNALFAPLPGEEPTATPSPTCSTQSFKKGQRIRSRQVQVSVFNGGTRAGLADRIQQSLVRRGFRRGSVGNAPEGVKVKVAQVWTTQRNDFAARLVARQFGRKTKVRVTSRNLGPGIDVVVGNDFEDLVKAKRVIVVRRASSVCVPSPGATSTAES